MTASSLECSPRMTEDGRRSSSAHKSPSSFSGTCRRQIIAAGSLVLMMNLSSTDETPLFKNRAHPVRFCNTHKSTAGGTSAGGLGIERKTRIRLCARGRMTWRAEDGAASRRLRGPFERLRQRHHLKIGWPHRCLAPNKFEACRAMRAAGLVVACVQFLKTGAGLSTQPILGGGDLVRYNLRSAGSETAAG